MEATEILDKDIAFEFERLFRSVQLESNSGMFGRAQELALKKAALTWIKEHPEKEKMAFLLESIPDVADDFYVFAESFYQSRFQELFQEAAEAWMKKRIPEED